MQLLFKLLRCHGVLLPPATVEAEPWTIARFEMSGSGRVLALHGLLDRPDLPPIAALYQPVVRQVDALHLVLRGIERIDDERGTAAVLQEWCLKVPPYLGGGGLGSPAAQGIKGWGRQ